MKVMLGALTAWVEVRGSVFYQWCICFNSLVIIIASMCSKVSLSLSLSLSLSRFLSHPLSFALSVSRSLSRLFRSSCFHCYFFPFPLQSLSGFIYVVVIIIILLMVIFIFTDAVFVCILL